MGAAHIHTSAKLNTGVEQVRSFPGFSPTPILILMFLSIPKYLDIIIVPHIATLLSVPKRPSYRDIVIIIFQTFKRTSLNTKHIFLSQYHHVTVSDQVFQTVSEKMLEVAQRKPGASNARSHDNNEEECDGNP